MEPGKSKYGGHPRGSNNSRKEQTVQTSDVDNGVLDSLESILNDMGYNSSASDYQPIIQFFRKGFANQVVQTWSYYAQTNNHPKTSHATSLLVKTLPILAAHPDTLQYGKSLIQLILTSYVKVLYRCLNNQRAQVTNPVLRLMKGMILFNNSQLVEDFLAYFDLSLPSLARILVPPKAENENKRQNDSGKGKNYKTMRETLLDFWILLISKTPALLRRDLLTDNSKIMGAWFKFIDKNDSEELVERAVTLFTSSILEEKFFKRTTKCKVLNELTISKLHHFYYSQNKELVKKVNQFFVIYGSSPEFSIAYPDNSVWFELSPITGSNTGVPVTIHQKEFKLHNKLLFNLLRILKPWEDDLQSTTTIKILKHTPELVAPYCTYIASLGTHDPKMTSYWFGMTLLLGRIIQIDIPEFIKRVETDSTPNESLVLENIIPSSLTKSALTKALQHENKIIQQLSCQLIVFVFQKLDKILQLYTQKGWSSQRAVISTMVLKNIPDLQIFTNSLTNTYNTDKNNQILQLSVSTILGYYSNIFSNFFSVTLQTPNIFTDIMEKPSFTGMDVAILDQFLQFQKFNGTQMRWWNATSNQNSLFSSLLKLASSKNSKTTMTLKITRLLVDLLHGTVIFDNNTLASPIYALINSLQIVSMDNSHTDNMTAIWKLLDECIARCMKTIYKYVDMSKEFDYISPFVMALTEQWKYVDRTTNFDITSKWVCLFLRSLVFVGESQRGIVNVVSQYLSDIPDDLKKVYFDFSEEGIETLKSQEYLINEGINSSYAIFVILSKWSTVESSQRIPINDLDAAVILVKLRQLADDENIELNGSLKNYVSSLCSNLTIYCQSTKTFNILDERIYGNLFTKILSDGSSKSQREKLIFIIDQVLKIETNIIDEDHQINQAFLDFTFKWLLNNREMIENVDCNSFRNLLVTLVGIVQDDVLKKLLSGNIQGCPKLVSTIVEKLYHNSSYNMEYPLLMELVTDTFEVTKDSIGRFIKEGRVNTMHSQNLLTKLISDNKYDELLSVFINSQYFISSEFGPLLNKLSNKGLKIIVANRFVNETNLSEDCEQFVRNIVEDCYKDYRDIDNSNFRLYFKLFSTYGGKYLTKEQNLNIIKFATEECEHKYSDSIIDLVKVSDVFTEDYVIKWLNKMTLYITKIFTECDVLTEKYLSVLQSFTELVKSINIWEKVNTNILNSQLEAILSKKWISDEEVINYALLVVLAAKQKDVESARLVQFILNNEDSPLDRSSMQNNLSYSIICLLYSLFIVDPTGNANVTVQKKLLTFYSGSISSVDRLILRMLEIIESTTSLVWTNNIYTWDFMEEDDEQTLDLMGNTKLFVEEKEGLILTLKKRDILFSTSKYRIDRPNIPELDDRKSNVELLKVLDLFYQDTEYLLPKETSHTIYDPLFLLLISIHNKELVSEKSNPEDPASKQMVFQVRKYLTSGLFQYFVGALGDSDKDIKQIALILLTQMMHTLENNQQFKDGNIFKILLKKIVYSSNNNGGENGEIIPIIWYATSRICDLLLHPTTQLYEKAYKWVLNGPSIRSNDIPMMYELISPSKPDINFEYYFSQLGWVLKTLEDGIRSKEDVDFLKKRSVMEWLSNITNVPYLNANMNSMIASIIYKIQRIDDGGSTLITRFGGVSDMELKNISIGQHLEEISESKRDHKITNSDKTLKKQLILEEQQLNTQEILSSYVEIINSKKRLLEWTVDDTQNLIKRVCK
ncbi:similar to Saccharomyces cerevisiae YKL014C URB1 Nucleolar protein required for the normal accumulation of 25S and 5.8S rRNAs, associated with the 27SA2 pre-ribosomal particle [Maudiozyma saulgeensis]|uniref:Similar to Saccharomyces cerevisiae YKL014C URB1 Nucleolar protein required for the normal accumulation of 25S and 5.8S rRNAs, associated with the 27SA2 pre-ribosomal particle n=1 Tax=Maudiozyma saulgeensis TaxID=1789683 RepID=A0A1X7RAH2_9SACH|nr:similar to Saccharomyces cerevisiae YKL014C URB1 Nucleolar protein required for the normal accumulation of 25S and 5.8S rRNAs, associated with the 27SA2 pre-ribosomal particle [Kazachstania saulgeensis]